MLGMEKYENGSTGAVSGTRSGVAMSLQNVGAADVAAG
jgi:hypothetical protein